MPGILAQFPDLTGLLNSRSLLVAGLRSVTGPLPLDPASLTGNLTAGLDALGNVVPANPQELIGPLQTALTSLAGAFPKEQIPALGDLSNGLSRALAIIAPAREILASENGLRDLQEIVFEQAGDPNVFIDGLLAELTKVIPADSVEAGCIDRGCQSRPSVRAAAKPVPCFEWKYPFFCGIVRFHRPVTCVRTNKRKKRDALIPVYLHGELNLDGIKAQLQQLNPGRLADELNQELETFLLRLTKFGDTLVAELPKLAETIKSGTTSFFPELVKEAFNTVYEPLRGQLSALDPASIIAELENGVFNPAKTALEGLNPATIFSELGIEERFLEFKATLDTLINNLRSIQSITARFWSELLNSLDQFDPARLKEQAEAAFVPAQQFITDLDLAGAPRHSIKR